MKSKNADDLKNTVSKLEMIESNGFGILIDSTPVLYGEQFYIFSLLEIAIAKKFALIDCLVDEFLLLPWGTLCLIAGSCGLTQLLYRNNEKKMFDFLKSVVTFYDQIFDSDNRIIGLGGYEGNVWTVVSNIKQVLAVLGVDKDTVLRSKITPNKQFFETILTKINY